MRQPQKNCHAARHMQPCARKITWQGDNRVMEVKASGGHPDAAGAAQLRNVVQRLVKAMLQEEALLPAPVHLQQPPQVARLWTKWTE